MAKRIPRGLKSQKIDTEKPTHSSYLGLNYSSDRRHDSIPKEEKEAYFGRVPIVIQGEGQRSQTFNEGYLGFGTVVSVTDYGDYRTRSKQDLIDEVRKNLIDHYAQYSSVVAEDGTIARRLIISTNRSGYAVIPNFSTVEPAKPSGVATFMERESQRQGAMQETERRMQAVGFGRQTHPDWLQSLA